MTSPADVARRVFAAVEARDLEALLDCYDTDVEIVEAASLPYGGTYTGRDAFLGDLLQQMLAAFELGLEDARTIDGGDAVVGQMTCVFTSRKTGKALRMPYVEVYGFEDGLIRTVDVYPKDTSAMVEFMERETA